MYDDTIRTEPYGLGKYPRRHASDQSMVHDVAIGRTHLISFHIMSRHATSCVYMCIYIYTHIHTYMYIIIHIYYVYT